MFSASANLNKSIVQTLNSAGHHRHPQLVAGLEVGPAEQLAPEEVVHLQTVITEPEARLMRGLVEALRVLDPAANSRFLLAPSVRRFAAGRAKTDP